MLLLLTDDRQLLQLPLLIEEDGGKIKVEGGIQKRVELCRRRRRRRCSQLNIAYRCRASQRCPEKGLSMNVFIYIHLYFAILLPSHPNTPVDAELMILDAAATAAVVRTQ